MYSYIIHLGNKSYLLSFDKDSISNQNFSKPEKYTYKIKKFIEMLHEYSLEKCQASIKSSDIKSIKIFNDERLFEITDLDDPEEYCAKYVEITASSPENEEKINILDSEYINMENCDIFEFFDGQLSKHFILCIRSPKLLLAVHFLDNKVIFYDILTREDLCEIYSDTLVFKNMLVCNSDPLNISRLDSITKEKSEDYSCLI